MMTLQQFSDKPETVPAITTCYFLDPEDREVEFLGQTRTPSPLRLR
jgi:hypothetical protein